MFDKELQSTYRVGRILASLFRSNWGANLFHTLADKPLKGKNIKGLACSEIFIPSQHGGPDIRTRIFKPTGINGPLPAMLYLHGGGYIVGTPENALNWIKSMIEIRPCIVVAPDYRKAMKHPFPDGFNDCYDVLLWIKQEGTSMGIDSQRIMVAGHSGGGGLTAAVSLKARDTEEVNIAFQLPLYPMIDDRLETESAVQMRDVPVWNSRSNAFAWDKYLARLREAGDAIPAYAAPAREVNYQNLPPTITFVGNMDPFRDETLQYVDKLKAAGVPIHFNLYQGGFHGFEIIKPSATISQKAVRFFHDAYAEYYDEYVVK